MRGNIFIHSNLGMLSLKIVSKSDDKSGTIAKPYPAISSTETLSLVEGGAPPVANWVFFMQMY